MWFRIYVGLGGSVSGYVYGSVEVVLVFFRGLVYGLFKVDLGLVLGCIYMCFVGFIYGTRNTEKQEN